MRRMPAQTQAARTDQQTGLYSRRGFEEALRAEFERAQRTNRSFSVLVGDITRLHAQGWRRYTSCAEIAHFRIATSQSSPVEGSSSA